MLPSLRRSSGPAIVMNASLPLYRNGHYPRVSEWLQAIPMLKADAMLALAPSGAGAEATFRLQMQIQRLGSQPTADYYDSDTDLAELTNLLPGSDTSEVRVARVGMRFSVPRLDAQVSVANTSGDAAQWRAFAAASASLAFLDTAIIQGTAGSSPQAIGGLAWLANGLSREQNASMDLDADIADIVTKVTPSGMAAGEGVDCLVTGVAGLRRLQMTTAGMQATSGWRHDKRTGLNIFHYRGIPVYRADVPEDGSTAIYAVNMGGTGVNLLHTLGTPDTFGLACEEEHLTTTRASTQYVVHGGYALVLWEQEAIWGLTGVALP